MNLVNLILSSFLAGSCSKAKPPTLSTSDFGSSRALLEEEGGSPYELEDSDSVFLQVSSPGVATIRDILVKESPAPQYKLMAMRPCTVQAWTWRNGNVVSVGSATVFVNPPALGYCRPFRVRLVPISKALSEWAGNHKGVPSHAVAA